MSKEQQVEVKDRPPRGDWLCGKSDPYEPDYSSELDYILAQ